MDSTEQNAHSQNSSIGFIPPQMDPEASTSTRALRENPLLLFIKDAGILITVLPYLPLLFFPLKTADQSAELSISKASIASYAIPVALFAAELAGLLLAIPAFLVLPGGYFFALLVLFCFSMILLALPTQGPRIVHSVVSDDTAESMASHNDERWLFVNGIATGHSGLQNNVDRISLTFGRPVIGIHNRSYGLISDLLECLIQRTMSFNSKDVRVTYEYVKAYLSEPAIKKVVLVAHSQGGIIISMVLDHLFSELPSSIISKLVRDSSILRIFLQAPSSIPNYICKLGDLHVRFSSGSFPQPCSDRPRSGTVAFHCKFQHAASLYSLHRTLLQRVRYGPSLGRVVFDQASSQKSLCRQGICPTWCLRPSTHPALPRHIISSLISRLSIE